MPGASSVLEDVLASDFADDPTRRSAAEPHRAASTARRRRRWGEDASLAAVTLSALGGFLALSRTIQGRGNAFDKAVVRRVGRVRHPISNAIGRGVTFFGSVGGIVGMSATALWLTRRRPRLAAQVLTGAFGGVGAELFIKRMFRRARPRILAHLEDVGSTSFPSGHAMASASLYLTLAFAASRNRRLRHRRLALLAGAAALAASVGASRVFLGVHWPTDALGGFALGTAWACAAEAAFDLAAADQVERETSSSST
jgi:undecaprenyl-diphosphatase